MRRCGLESHVARGHRAMKGVKRRPTGREEQGDEGASDEAADGTDLVDGRPSSSAGPGRAFRTKQVVQKSNSHEKALDSLLDVSSRAQSGCTLE